MQFEREQITAGAQPIPSFGGSINHAGSSTEFNLRNDGAAVTDVTITPINFSDSTVSSPRWNKGANLKIVSTHAGDEPLELKISYRDAIGVSRTTTYQVGRKPWGTVREIKS